MFKVFKQSHILVNHLLGLHSKSQIEIQLFWEINEYLILFCNQHFNCSHYHNGLNVQHMVYTNLLMGKSWYCENSQINQLWLDKVDRLQSMTNVCLEQGHELNII